MSGHPQRVDVVLRLLDHQVLDPDGSPVGKVDDVALCLENHVCTVAGLLVGMGALSHRWPGRLGRWTLAIWCRLHPHTDPRRGFVDLGEVTAVEAGITVTADAGRRLGAGASLELWLRRYVVSRLPGGGDPPRTDCSDRAVDAPGGGLGRAEDELLSLGQLLQCRVVDADGVDLGAVRDVHADVAWTGTGDHCPVHPGHPHRARVTHVTFGPRGSGSVLGYNRTRHQGPVALAVAVRWLHRAERRVRWSEIAEVDLPARRVRLTAHARPVHPLDAD